MVASSSKFLKKRTKPKGKLSNSSRADFGPPLSHAMALDLDIFDDLFHGCAFAAYVEESSRSKGVPCVERTRILAYRYYEEALAEKNNPTDKAL